jgi:F-type H+-transporting ATPase subunit b
MELLKLLSTNEIVAQLVSFLLVFWLLRAMLWKRLLGIIDDRRERIAVELKTIAATKAETEKIKAVYEAKVRDIDLEAAERMKLAAEEADRQSEETRRKAQAQAQEIVENAKATTRYELVKAREQLKDEIVDLTIQAAENIIGEKLTVDQDRKIVEDFLKNIDKETQ